MSIRIPISFKGKWDLPSINQSVEHHLKLLGNPVLGKRCKFYRTQDQQSLAIANKLLETDFQKETFLSNPGQSLNQTQSLVVKVKSIHKNPQYLEAYNQWLLHRTKPYTMLLIGGPAAIDQTLLSSLIPQIYLTSQIDYYTRSYLQSNLMHPTWQSCARKGSALNCKMSNTGLNILKVCLRRRIMGLSIKQIMDMAFYGINVNSSGLRQFYGYLRVEVNGIVQRMKRYYRPGQLNQFDLGRLDTVVSQEIQIVMQKLAEFSFNSNYQTFHSNPEHYDKYMNIQLFIKNNHDSIIKQQTEQYSRIPGLKLIPLSEHDLKSYFPYAYTNKKIEAGYRLLGDYANNFDTYQKIRTKSVELGANWSQNMTVKEILVRINQQNNRIEVCGVKFEDSTFVPANKVHLSLGYKVKYIYEDGSQCLDSYNIPVTGASCNYLLKITPSLRENLMKNGEFSLTLAGSHFSTVFQNTQHLIVRGVLGTNIASEAYCPQHFLSLTYSARQIFDQALIGVLSIYGCSQAVNFKNMTQFVKLADGLIVSYGKGINGSMKRSSQAYKALKYLGYGEELKRFFKYHQSKRLNIIQTIQQVCQLSQKTGVFSDKTKNTTRKILIEG